MTVLLLGSAAAQAQVAEEPTVTLERACENPASSRILVIGSGFAPNQQLLSNLTIVQNNQIVFFVEGAFIRASSDGTFEIPAEWEGPASTFTVTFADAGFPPSFPFIVETLSVDCSKPVARQECKKGGWRAFAFKNQGQCVASVQRPQT
jgi:hypothetical protein